MSGNPERQDPESRSSAATARADTARRFPATTLRASTGARMSKDDEYLEREHREAREYGFGGAEYQAVIVQGM